jgi:hypothetical protein
VRLLLAAALGLAALAGCIHPETIPITRGCVADGNQADGDTYALLLAHPAPAEVRAAGERAEHRVRVLPGQDLAVDAAWDAAQGSARLLLDNRSVTQPAPSSTYGWSGPASPGVHVLELEGAPLAFEARVTLAVTAFCRTQA